MKKIFFTLLLGALYTHVYAQINLLNTGYYQNQFIANPAMAGLDPGMNINLVYRKQWNNIPGAPSTQAMTGEYGFESNAGIGLNFYNEKAGLQRWTRAEATYAYHLPLDDDDSKLNFGLSLGLSNERLDQNAVIGEDNDGSILQYNKRSYYIDSDFGVAYTSNKLTLQAAVPNLKSFFKKEEKAGTVDRSSFFAAASYKMEFDTMFDGVMVEPKVTYRGLKGLHSIIDAGTAINFVDQGLNLLAIYHSTKSTTFGLGMQYQAVNIMGMYTTETSALKGYINGDFEIGLRVKIF